MEKEEFLGILKTKKSAPFLFLGSGFTKHYLNTPKWDELLQHFSSKPPECDEHRFVSSIRSQDDYLKLIISKYLLDYTIDGIPEKSISELNFLSSINIDGIITTNWDDLAELVFPKFNICWTRRPLVF